MTKLSDVCIAFCVSLGGISLILVKQADMAVFITLLVVSIIVCCLYTANISKNRLPSNAFKGADGFLSVCAVSSCAVSVVTACSLVADTGVLPRTQLPLIVTVTAAFVLCLSVSSRHAVIKTVTVTVIFAVVIITVLLVLCVTQVDSIKIKTGNINVEYLFPLVTFSVCDLVFAFPLLRKNKNSIFSVGIILPIIYMGIMTLITLSALSYKVFYSVEMPIMKLWQSTYIASFLDRYETLAIAAFFIVTAVKAGIILNHTVEVFTKRCIPLIGVLLFILILLIFRSPVLIYFSVALSFVSGILIPAIALCKRPSDC